MLSPLAPVPRLEPAPRNATPDDAQVPEPGTRFADLLRERRAPAPPASAGDRAAGASDTVDPAHAPQATATPTARSRPSAGTPKQAAKDEPEPAQAKPSTSAQPALSTPEAALEASSEQPIDSAAAGASDALPALPLPGVQPGAMPVPPSGEGAQAFDAAGSRPPGAKSTRDAARLAAAAQADASPVGLARAAETSAAQQAAPGPILAAPTDATRGEPLRPGTEPAAPAAAPPSFARVLAQAAPPAVALPTPLAAPNFGETLAAQVSIFARDGVQQAELRLNPPEMGPIGVQIELVGNDARINFQAAQAQTREVIERALPELAGALRDQGLTLTGGGVSDQAAQPRQAPAPRSMGFGVTAEDPNAAPAPRTVVAQVREGLLDLYA